MRRTTLAFITIAVLTGCAFEAGPARWIRVTVMSPSAATVTTDRGWQVDLSEARLFVHYVRFLSGEAASGETGHTHEALLALTDEETGELGTIRLAHTHAAEETPAAGAKVGELLADVAVDLLAAPRGLGEAV
ncbi:MAG: hypothetical protein QME96_04980, partial [Myxococcota bacterium]|nr:hypothetical protein [Myxococcota bacterium]